MAAITEQLEPGIAELKRQEAEPLEHTGEAEQPREGMPAPDSQELRELSELARRLR